jgi:hypothetical protein
MGTGGGTVSSTPAGINCTAAAGGSSGACSARLEAGTAVTLNANPAAGSVFTGWSGACGGTGSCQVALDGDRAVTAGFDLATFTLRVTGAGTGSGSISSQSGLTPAIACGSSAGAVSGNCVATYLAGTVVTLSATPSIGSVFDGWGGACSGASVCSVTVSQARSVTARFATRNFALTLSASGDGAGTIATGGASPELSCQGSDGRATGACSGVYPAGTVVTLTAAAGTGSRFAGWSGACSGTESCSVTLDQARAVVAAFELIPFTLTVTGSGGGNGRVTADPTGIDCGLDAGTASGVCASAFPSGTRVTLTATPAPGSTFAGWNGACGGTGPCVVTVTEAVGVSAAFGREALTLTVAGAGDGEGAVAAEPAGIACAVASGTTSGTCSAEYASGTSVTLTATATSGSAFGGWDGACGGTGDCVVSVTQATAVTATFTRRSAGVRVAGAGSGSGSVASAVGGLACSVTDGVASASGCRIEVALGGVVTLTATAEPGSLFAGWGGVSACTSETSCSITVSSETAITARFIPQPPAGVAAGDLLGSPHLTPEQQSALDQAGNHNGRFDVGDYLALLDREGR